MRKLDWDTAITLLSPHSYSLLSTLDESGRANLMGLSWWAITSWNPPMIVVSVGKGQYTRKCLDATPEFTLCFPNVHQARGAWICGTVSGRDGDKFRMGGFEPLSSSVVKPPLVRDATVGFECRVVQQVETGDHVLYIGEVLAIHGSPEKAMHLFSIHYNRLVGLDHELNVSTAPEHE